MQTNQSGQSQQFTNWVNSASPDELFGIGTQVLSRISTLPQTQRDKFYTQVQNDPSISKLFNQTV